MSDWTESYYQDVDSMRLEPYVAQHSEDAVVIFANNPPAVGRAAIGEAIGGFWSMIGGLRHERRNTWFENDGNTAILEVVTHYTTKGGAAVPLACASILDRDPASGLVTSLRVHIDTAPLFAAIAHESAPEAAQVSS